MKTRVARITRRISHLTIKVYAVRPDGSRVELPPATPPVAACGIEWCECLDQP